MFKLISLAFVLFGISQVKSCQSCYGSSSKPSGFSGLSGFNGFTGFTGLSGSSTKLKTVILPVPSITSNFGTGKTTINTGNIGHQSSTQYIIRSSYGNVLDISQSKPTNAIIYGFHGGANQRFTITRDGENSIIRSVQNNGVLESNSQGNVCTGAFNNTPNEKWRINKVQGSNLFTIVNAADGNCLDLKQSRNVNDNDVINYPCHGLPNQLWQIIPITPGSNILPVNYHPYCNC